MRLTLENMERNNLAQAVAYYEERGKISMEEWRMLHDLQDDPAEFDDLSYGWDVIDPEEILV